MRGDAGRPAQEKVRWRLIGHHHSVQMWQRCYGTMTVVLRPVGACRGPASSTMDGLVTAGRQM